MAEMQPILQPIPPGELQPEGDGAFISQRLRNPGEDVSAKPAANYTLAGIFSIIAFLAFVVLLILLYQDWSALKIA
jgi:hypothetical protein